MADGANRYSKACDAMTALRAKAAGAFDLGYKLLAMCQSAGLAEPEVSRGEGFGWAMVFPAAGGRTIRVWVGTAGGLELRAGLDGDRASNQTPEQAVLWLKERVK